MLNFFKIKIAKIWASNHYKKSNQFKQNAIADQNQLLLELVKQAEKSLFGRIHQFETIKSVEDFQKKVPIRDYEGLSEWVEHIKKGKRNILWNGLPEYFAKTSGTTSGSKYIPISKEGMPYQIAAAQSAIFHYIHQKENASFVTGKMIFLQGSPYLEELNGIKTGRLSGIVAHHIPRYLQKNRLPSWDTNTIEDWETKVNKIVEETIDENMSLISGIPPWLIMYFENLIDKKQKPITEIFPNLQLIITGGVNYEPYREKMLELLGKPVDILQTFPASEGFFAFQDDYTADGLLLLTNHGIFYEFIPLEDYDKPEAARLKLEDIELGKDYALVISTNSGLWAYSIGDVVRFVSKKPYRIVVSGRTKHFTSAFGEHVIGYEVEEALKAAISKMHCSVIEFHLAPECNPKADSLAYHEWFFEFEKEPKSIEAFSLILDQELRNRNTYYDDLISGKVLRPLIITRLQKKAFQEYAKSVGKLGGQNKTPRLSNDRKIADILLNFKL